MSSELPSPKARKGRGAVSNPDGRFATRSRVDTDDGWNRGDETPRRVETELLVDSARTIIARNQSPDVPFDRSINPYKGCEHGCVYCYARPTHAYLDLSPGLDFETRIFYKPDAARLLEEELRHPGYRCAPIAMGTNTDPYQPAEERLAVTRRILETLVRFRHPVTITTKGAGVERDIDLLSELARDNLAAVMISVTTLDNALKRILEPRTAGPAKRLALIEKLRAAGIPVGALVAPVIPSINDSEIERILEACKSAGAMTARYILLRLPFEVSGLFREWLETHYPLRAQHVMSLVQQSRGGKDYDPRWGLRMKGTGIFAPPSRSASGWPRESSVSTATSPRSTPIVSRRRRARAISSRSSRDQPKRTVGRITASAGAVSPLHRALHPVESRALPFD